MSSRCWRVFKPFYCFRTFSTAFNCFLFRDSEQCFVNASRLGALVASLFYDSQGQFNIDSPGVVSMLWIFFNEKHSQVFLSFFEVKFCGIPLFLALIKTPFFIFFMLWVLFVHQNMFYFLVISPWAAAFFTSLSCFCCSCTFLGSSVFFSCTFFSNSS